MTQQAKVRKPKDFRIGGPVLAYVTMARVGCGADVPERLVIVVNGHHIHGLMQAPTAKRYAAWPTQAAAWIEQEQGK